MSLRQSCSGMIPPGLGAAAKCQRGVITETPGRLSRPSAKASTCRTAISRSASVSPSMNLQAAVDEWDDSVEIAHWKPSVTFAPLQAGKDSAPPGELGTSTGDWGKARSGKLTVNRMGRCLQLKS